MDEVLIPSNDEEEIVTTKMSLTLDIFDRLPFKCIIFTEVKKLFILIRIEIPNYSIKEFLNEDIFKKADL